MCEKLCSGRYYEKLLRHRQGTVIRHNLEKPTQGCVRNYIQAYVVVHTQAYVRVAKTVHIMSHLLVCSGQDRGICHQC